MWFSSDSVYVLRVHFKCFICKMYQLHIPPLTERLDFFPVRFIFFNITDTERRCFFIYNYRDNLPEGREEFTVRVYTLFSERFATDVKTAQIILVDDDGECVYTSACRVGEYWGGGGKGGEKTVCMVVVSNL